jgi:hypothetical protein
MGLWLPQGVTDLEGIHEPARHKVRAAWVGGNLDRKFRSRRSLGERSRGRKDLFSSFICAFYVSCDRAEVNRLEVLVLMGSRLCRESAVPGPFGTSVCCVGLVSSNPV